MAIQRVTRGYVDDAVATLEASLQATAVRESEGGASTVARHMASSLTAGLTLLTTDGLGYFVYLGVTPDAITYARVRFYVSTAALGVQTTEVGLFSSPLAPNRGGQTLTKIEASGSVDSLLSTGSKTSSSAFTTAVAAGTHLWGAVRFSFTITLPTVLALSNDMGQGCVLHAAACGALTGLTTIAATVPAASLVGVAPAMFATQD